jgi:hypothetical protein
MASRYLATMNRPPSAIVRAAASIGAALAFVVIVLGVYLAVVQADAASGEPRQADTNVPRTAQNPPPARVILPAPWEQAAPARPAAAPTNRK